MSERYVPDRLVTVGEIAKIAGVFPSAVSNWRGRNQAFPQPRESTSGSDRFLLTEVIAWLERTGREYQLPADTDELLRDWVALVSGSHTRFSAIEQGIEVLAIRAHAKPKVWSDLVGAEPSDILSRLRVAALSAGAACDGLTWFATEQLYEAREGDWTSFTPAEIRHLVDAVNALQREQFGEVDNLALHHLGR